MSSTLAKATVLLACLGLFACGEEKTPPGGGTGGTIGGTGGSGGSGGSDVTEGVCGNGIQEEGEECDDADQDNSNGCLDTCRLARCGDGEILVWGDEPEECDGGVANSDTEPNACRTNCKFAHCGDGVIDDGEICDDGPDNNMTEPGACRPAHAPNGFACKPGGCGDGVLDPGEACDDGNDDNDDGCRNDCSIPRCGDGIKDPGELCDDGNDFDNDECTNECKPAACGDGIIGPGELCDDGNTISTDNCVWPACVPNVCGDGIPNDNNSVEACEPSLDRNCRADCTHPAHNDGRLDLNEECDDGNLDPTDACHNGKWSFCGDGRVWAGVEECDPLDTTPGAPLCRSGRGPKYDCTIPRLNDGILDPELGEECDDGNQSPYDGCLPTGKLPTCGDGYKNGTEACDASDPNNTITNCRSDCTIAPVCGDGIRHAEEDCDDGNPNSGDGCSGTDAATPCKLETGFTCTGTPSVCKAICGDGKVLGAEVCDDGNTANNDGCNSTCTAVTTGWTCTGGSATTPSVCSAVCGDGIVISGREACDDNNTNNDDACISCQHATLPFTFTDFTTTNVEATMRSLVKVKAQLTPAIASTFDPNALLRYRITVTKGTTPAAGVYAYFKKATDGADHTTWSEEIFTDANGVAWFGPAAGATAAQLGIDTSAGAETPFSVVFPTDGSHKVKLELINVSRGNITVGTTEHTFTVGTKKLNVTFNGFNGFLEGVPSTTTLSASLSSTVTGTLHWEALVTRTDAGGNQVGVQGVDVNGVLTAGADGRAVLPGFAATTLHGTTKTLQFPMLVPDAGTYQLRLELRNASNALVGHATTQMVVTYDRVVFTQVDFDGIADSGFAAGIRNQVSFAAELDGRWPSTASGNPVNGKWQVTVTKGATPAAGVGVFYATGSDDPADHATWSGTATTGSNGKADVGGLFALDSLKVTDGVAKAWSLLFPTTGLHTVRFDLVEENGTVVDGHSVDVNVVAPVTVTFRDFDLLWAGVRGEVRVMVSLHKSFDANTAVQLKLTLADGAGTAVVGHKAYYPLSSDGTDPQGWSQFIQTGTGGVAVFPAAALPVADTNLQRPGGHSYRFGPEFTAAGPYTLRADLVLGSDNGVVIGGGSHSFTVAAP